MYKRQVADQRKVLTGGTEGNYMDRWDFPAVHLRNIPDVYKRQALSNQSLTGADTVSRSSAVGCRE